MCSETESSESGGTQWTLVTVLRNANIDSDIKIGGTEIEVNAWEGVNNLVEKSPMNLVSLYK